MDQFLVWLGDVPPSLMYVVLGVGAAVENIVPPIPADTFVLLGGFLAARGSAVVGVVFLVTWTANVLSALAVYTLAYRYGDTFFQTRLGKYLLDPRQVGIVRKFYRRWGAAAIFYTRFLPGLRAVAPVFAGLIRQRPRAVVLPLVLASAIWYGALVWVGAFAGRNIDDLLTTQTRLNSTLGIIAGAIIALLAWWWFHSRARRAGATQEEPETEPEPEPEPGPKPGPGRALQDDEPERSRE